jgi:chemotaxis protein methyltransferase CheR
MVASADTEFTLTDRDFKRIQVMVKSRAGIDLGEGKRSLVYGRLSRRLRSLGLGSFREYLDLLEQPHSTEAVHFLNAITTNVTAFFREAHHFEFLRGTVLPSMWAANASTKRLRIWSAGCSTGEEPYSIAMTVLQNIPKGQIWDIKILATDIDTAVLSQAHAGEFSAERVKAIAPSVLRSLFEEIDHGAWRAKPELRAMISFKQLNLLGDWPMKGTFDFIFCRNVIIYFDSPTRLELIRRYRQVLRPDGCLFLGHSESMVGQQAGMRSLSKTVYGNDDGTHDRALPLSNLGRR